MKITYDVLELVPVIGSIIKDNHLIDNLVHDDISYEQVLDNLQDELLVQVAINNEFAGFFCIEDLGTYTGIRVAEIHAFIIPSMRKYSLTLMKDFKNYIFSVTSFGSIVTTVSSNTPKVDRAIKLVGFKQFEEKENTAKFNGNSVSTKYFYLNKE